MLTDKLSSEYLSLGEIYSISWSAFKENFKTIVLLTLAISIPVEAVSYYSERTGSILDSLTFILVSMAVAFIVESYVHGKSKGVSESFMRALSIWPSGFLASFLSWLIVIGLTLLLIIPGIMWAVYYTFILYIVILRSLKGKKALDYSKALVVGRWWTVFGYTLVFGVTAAALFLLLTLPYMLVVAFVGEVAILEIVDYAISDVAFSFFIVLEIVFFLNLDYVRNNTIEAAVA